MRSHSVHEKGREMRVTGELLGIKRLMKARIGIVYGEEGYMDKGATYNEVYANCRQQNGKLRYSLDEYMRKFVGDDTLKHRIQAGRVRHSDT